MAWAGARGVPRHIRQQVINRDGTCQLRFPGCTADIDEIDHIVNVARLGIARADANQLENLQGVCKPCHRIKTRQEARSGQNRWKRQAEQHPGLIRPAQ